MNGSKNISNNVIGIIPCAGKGTRLGRLPFSKELYPIGDQKKDKIIIPKVACSYLIDHMSDAGIKNIHFVLRNGKWDIPAYFEGGLNIGIKACYHIADYEYGVPFSVYQALAFVSNETVVLGFPDILFKPRYAYNKLLEELTKRNDTEIVLGVMPVLKPQKWDMVELDRSQNIKRIIIKSIEGESVPYGWTLAAWKPGFSEFIKNRIEELLKLKKEKDLLENELYFGDILIDALNSGMTIGSVVFKNGNCIDIGTIEDLNKSQYFLNKNE